MYYNKSMESKIYYFMFYSDDGSQFFHFLLFQMLLIFQIFLLAVWREFLVIIKIFVFSFKSIK